MKTQSIISSMILGAAIVWASAQSAVSKEEKPSVAERLSQIGKHLAVIDFELSDLRLHISEDSRIMGAEMWAARMEARDKRETVWIAAEKAKQTNTFDSFVTYLHAEAMRDMAKSRSKKARVRAEALTENIRLARKVRDKTRQQFRSVLGD